MIHGMLECLILLLHILQLCVLTLQWLQYTAFAYTYTGQQWSEASMLIGGDMQWSVPIKRYFWNSHNFQHPLTGPGLGHGDTGTVFHYEESPTITCVYWF